MSYACASKRTKRLGRAEGRPRSRSPLLGPARAIVFSQGPLTPGCSEDLLYVRAEGQLVFGCLAFAASVEIQIND